MAFTIRPAEPRDVPQIAALQFRDATVRQRLNPHLWAVDAEAATRIESSLRAIGQPRTGPISHHWLVLEQEGSVMGFAHGILLPAPPIYDASGPAGVLLDDCHFPEDDGMSNALLNAMERILTDGSAVVLVAAVPADWNQRRHLFAAAAYEPTTLFMVKAHLPGDRETALSRRATEADVAGIVRLSASHREQLQVANPVFWRIHPQADERFSQWMRFSLGLADRNMFVLGTPEEITGYIIAQPATPLHLPPAHNGDQVGLIDDFYVAAFAPDDQSQDRIAPLALLSAAQKALFRRGKDIALAVCPVKMERKQKAMEAAGYAGANLWMVKA